ncbi:MAG: hypothetical protein KME17_16180 [Cyanosarcina radialis HA8281-LM2]|jgi:hypothetical protein|nr:hypothetical protein [Cyanosarcina radialis HA8281-LM2]
MEDEREFFLQSSRYFAIALGILLFAPLVLTIFTYRGTCTPMLDGPTRPCSLGAYVSDQIIFAQFLTLFLVPIPAACWGYAVGRYWKFKLGRTGISHLLPFACPLIGGIVGFYLGLYFPFIIILVLSPATR